jgi:hypothetical protein
MNLEAMLKKILFFICVLVMFATLLGTQRWVVGEVMTISWCGTCPAARSALNTMAENEASYPYFIPIIWQGDTNASPSISTRQNLYDFYHWPWIQFGGSNYLWPFNTSVGNTQYNNISSIPSPLTLEIDYQFTNDQLFVTANFEILSNITTANNKIYFLLTYDWGTTYNNSVVRYNEQDFIHLTAGQNGVMSTHFAINSSWDIERLAVIGIVQTTSGNKEILQAGRKRVVMQDPPDNVTLESPADSLTNASIRPIFSWIPSTTEPIPSAYNIQISTSSTFNTFLVNQNVNHPNTTYSLPSSTVLQNSTVYYWRVIARTIGGIAEPPYPMRSLTTHPRPGSPRNLTANVEEREVTLSWNPPNTGSYDGFIVYREATRLTPEPISELTFTDRNAPNGTYFYYVTSFYIETESFEAPVSVTVNSTSEIDAFGLLNNELIGNYPNPFNPTTSIMFRVAGCSSLDGDFVSISENISIDIFNIRGQKIRTLLDERFSPGEHSVAWDGTDDTGNFVGSGIYLYRMSVGSYSSTKKLILMK